jgi:hypothetical protein
MRDFYEEAAAEFLSLSNLVTLPEGSPWTDFYEEAAGELLSLANDSPPDEGQGRSAALASMAPAEVEGNRTVPRSVVPRPVPPGR